MAGRLSLYPGIADRCSMPAANRPGAATLHQCPDSLKAAIPQRAGRTSRENDPPAGLLTRGLSEPQPVGRRLADRGTALLPNSHDRLIGNALRLEAPRFRHAPSDCDSGLAPQAPLTQRTLWRQHSPHLKTASKASPHSALCRTAVKNAKSDNRIKMLRLQGI